MSDKRLCCAHLKDVKDQPIYSVYRVKASGNPSIIIQAQGSCMVDGHGVLSKEALLTVKGEMGENVARSIANGRSMHFHVNMEGLMRNISQCNGHGRNVVQIIGPKRPIKE